MSLLSQKSHLTLLRYGRFDRFSQTELDQLRDLSRKAETVIIGCMTDTYARQIGQPCQTPYTTRRARLEKCRYVSRVIAYEGAAQHHSDIVNYDVSAVILSAAWQGRLDDIQDITRIFYAPAPALVPFAQAV